MPGRRILLITPGYAAPDDPVCLPGLRDLVAELSTRHDVVVMALRYPYTTARYTLDGAMIVPLGGAHRRGWSRLRMVAAACRTAERVCLEHRVDVVQAFWADEPGFVAAVLKARLGLPTVVSLAGGELAAIPARGFGVQLQCLGRLWTACALGAADAVTVGSPWLQRLLAQMPTVGRAAQVAPLGARLDRFNCHGPKRALGPGFHLVHVGSAVPVKGHDLLLQAWAAIQREARCSGVFAPYECGATLHLVGAGTDQMLDLPACTVCHGEVPHAELPALLRACDAWLQSSVFESQSVAAIEAAGCGLALAGTAVGLLADCPAAVARCTADAADLARCIGQVLTDRSILKTAGQAAQDWAEAGYDATSTALAFEAVHDAVASAAQTSAVAEVL